MGPDGVLAHFFIFGGPWGPMTFMAYYMATLKNLGPWGQTTFMAYYMATLKKIWALMGLDGVFGADFIFGWPWGPMTFMAYFMTT